MEIMNMKDYIVFDQKGVSAKVIYQTTHCKAMMFNFLPGQRVPPHKHPDKHVLIQVVSGEIMVQYGTVKRKATCSDLVWVHGDELVSMSNETERESSVRVLLHD